MTDLTDQLDAIQARVDAATPGPWEIVTSQWHPPTIYADGSGLDIALLDDRPSNDAEFIANAPTDIGFLLDLARKQQAAIDAVKAAVQQREGFGLVSTEAIREALEAKP